MLINSSMFCGYRANITKRIDKDPLGIDAKTNTYFYSNAGNQVFFDAEGERPVRCDEQMMLAKNTNDS